jgi:hypothetical protein
MFKSSTSNMLLSDLCNIVVPAANATLAVWRNAAGTPGKPDLQWDLALGAANKLAAALSSWLQQAGAAAEAAEIRHATINAAELTAAAAAAAAGQADTDLLHHQQQARLVQSLVQRVMIECLLQHPDVATLLAIQVACAAHALHQAHSSCSNSSSSSSSSGQEEQQQQQQEAAESAPANTTNARPKQLYQLLLDAAGVPGLGCCSRESSSSSSSSSSDDSAVESSRSSSNDIRDVHDDMCDLVSGTIPAMQALRMLLR